MHLFMAGGQLRGKEKIEKKELLKGMRMAPHDKGEVRVRGAERETVILLPFKARGGLR